MKIAIPVKEKSMETEVYESFGRAPYFLIYDLDTKESNFIENEAAQARGGAGIIAAQTIVDSKVDVLLTPRLGKNAADVIVAADVKMYKSVDGLVEKNIELYEEEKLELLDEIHSGFHSNGEK